MSLIHWSATLCYYQIREQHHKRLAGNLRTDMWPRRRKEKMDEYIVAAAQSVVMPMGQGDLNECWRLDQRCFSDGEAYDRETIRYLLSHVQSVCHKIVSPADEMMAFVVGMIEPDNTGHVVALGVAPEHRRLGHGQHLMYEVEQRFLRRGVSTVRLEVRTSNVAAQRLYLDLGYKIVRRMPRYYTSGDDGYLMVKSLS
jgi:ribosomal protein S18 acetylase RimI-like enzyme